MGQHSRSNPLIFVVVAVVIVALLVVLGAIGLSMVGDDRDEGAAVPETAPVAVSQTALSGSQRCVVETMNLLGRALMATQEGSTQGLDMTQVAARFGADSATFQTFSATQTTLIGRVIQEGPEGQLRAIQGEVKARCRELT